MKGTIHNRKKTVEDNVPIDDDDTKCNKPIMCSTLSDYIPEYMKYEYILQGYRINISFKDSLLSLFSLHNETFNIWTALISFATFLYIGIDILFIERGMSFWEKVAYIVYTCSAIYTFLGSLLYHWFHCIDHSHHECLLRMDISGIGFLIMGSYYPPIYYSFQDVPNIGIMYLTLVTSMCLFCSAMFFIPKFSHDDYRLFRVFVFGCTALFGMIPLIHIFALHLGNLNTIWRVGSAVIELYLWYGLAVFFYASKIPEKYFPGLFDTIGCSHQFWHIFVFVATVVHYYRCTTTYSMMQNVIAGEHYRENLMMVSSSFK
ncbi:adiponectin receptor ADIPOR [Acrasis kona]|uniref:Adiponectin receptor ADIPOR n=1 Tax=Acrasis kona TaxID=1008807 RepID=A0AAW2YXI8_9EUKA